MTISPHNSLPNNKLTKFLFFGPLGLTKSECNVLFPSCGDHTLGATPVPIPNTVVKPKWPRVVERRD